MKIGKGRKTSAEQSHSSHKRNGEGSKKPAKFLKAFTCCFKPRDIEKDSNSVKKKVTAPLSAILLLPSCNLISAALRM